MLEDEHPSRLGINIQPPLLIIRQERSRTTFQLRPLANSLLRIVEVEVECEDRLDRLVPGFTIWRITVSYVIRQLFWSFPKSRQGEDVTYA